MDPAGVMEEKLLSVPEPIGGGSVVKSKEVITMTGSVDGVCKTSEWHAVLTIVVEFTLEIDDSLSAEA